MIAILGVMVILLAGGLAPTALDGLLAAGAVLTIGILTVEQAWVSRHRSTAAA